MRRDDARHLRQGHEQADFDRRHADCLEVEAEKRREGA
jgi:hypothetical protein